MFGSESHASWPKASEGVTRVVLHIARNPQTGVWAFMRELAEEQNRIGGVVAGLGVLADRRWGASYRRGLLGGTLPWLFSRQPTVFGTAAHLLLALKNPINRWGCFLARRFPDAEIMFHFHTAWMTGVFLPLDAGPRVAAVATFHGIADRRRLNSIGWLRAAHRYMARRLARSDVLLSAVSQSTARDAETLFGISARRFAVIANGLSEPRVDPRTPVRSKDAFTVGFVGQLHHGKGWHLAAAAVEQLYHEGLPIRLLIAGTGMDSAEVEAMATRSQCIQYLGFVPDAGRNLVPGLDVLVLPSWEEGMPVVVIEALAAGVPVVATPVGGIAEMLRDGVTGLFVDRSVSSVRCALQRLAEDRELWQALCARGRSLFVSRYTIAHSRAEYDRLYDAAFRTFREGGRLRRKRRSGGSDSVRGATGGAG